VKKEVGGMLSTEIVDDSREVACRRQTHSQKLRGQND